MKEIEFYLKCIDDVIIAQSGKDLKIILNRVHKYKWVETNRYMFILGLLQGSLMQFNKEASIEELKTLFYK